MCNAHNKYTLCIMISWRAMWYHYTQCTFVRTVMFSVFSASISSSRSARMISHCTLCVMPPRFPACSRRWKYREHDCSICTLSAQQIMISLYTVHICYADMRVISLQIYILNIHCAKYLLWHNVYMLSRHAHVKPPTCSVAFWCFLPLLFTGIPWLDPAAWIWGVIYMGRAARQLAPHIFFVFAFFFPRFFPQGYLDPIRLLGLEAVYTHKGHAAEWMMCVQHIDFHSSFACTGIPGLDPAAWIWGVIHLGYAAQRLAPWLHFPHAAHFAALPQAVSGVLHGVLQGVLSYN